MNLIVKINGVDKTSLVEWTSFGIDDAINEQPNLCNFTIKVYDGQSYTVSVNDEVEVYDQASKIFSGKILRLNNRAQGQITLYEVEAKDHTLDLDRIIVNERFEDKTPNYIIDYIITNYLSGFGITDNNVNCTLNIDTIAFNKVSVSKAITMLADLLNYSWYIDYDKDIHFFAKNDKSAPFDISEGSDNYIIDSLDINNDLSQLRNVVIVRGGEKTADNTRTKKHTGDGAKQVFNTDYEFSSKPVVKVDGVTKNVGTENLDEDASFDCMWSFEQKYIRFITAVTSGASIEIISYPLIPIIVQVEENGSIGQYGRFEFVKIDKSIRSTNEAKLFAQAQLDAYGATVREGGFRTYESGLSSGQTISINLPNRGVTETFLIQRVTLSMVTATQGEWAVELATMRTMGIIKFLQDLLVSDNRKLTLSENEVLEKYFMDNQQVNVQEEISLKEKMQDFQQVDIQENVLKDPFGAGVKPDFVLCPYTPTGNTDPKREFVLDRCTLG